MDELNIWMKGVLSGGPVRMDGTTFYLHGGKVRVCSSRRARRKERTEGEKLASERFAEVRKMWRVFRRVFGELEVWRVAAREVGKARGDTLFHALNGGCIRPGDGVWAWSAFSFAAGSLDKAAGVEARREGWEGITAARRVLATRCTWGIFTRGWVGRRGWCVLRGRGGRIAGRGWRCRTGGCRRARACTCICFSVTRRGRGFPPAFTLPRN